MRTCNSTQAEEERKKVERDPNWVSKEEEPLSKGGSLFQPSALTIIAFSVERHFSSRT